MNQKYAEGLARRLEEYWRKLGFDVRATAVLEADSISGRAGSSSEWTVRTDPPLKNGLPVGAKQTLVTPILRSFDRAHTDWRKFDDEQPEA
jgi:hypothetical protein